MVSGKSLVALIPISMFLIFSINTFRNSTRLNHNIYKRQRNRPEKYASLPYETLSISDIVSKYPKEKQESASKNITGFAKAFIWQYMKFHKRARRKCEAIENGCNSTRLLVFGNKINVGLGDRIRGLLFSLLIASFTDRILLINITDPFPLQKVLQNSNGMNYTYDSAVFPISKTRNTTEVIHNTAFKNITDYETKSRVILSNATDSFDISLILACIPYFSSARRKASKYMLSQIVLHRADIAPLVLQSLFQPSTLLRDRIMIRQKRNALTPNSVYVGVHGRFGRGLGESPERFNVSKIGLTLQSAALCFGRAVGRHSLDFGTNIFYLSTDTRSLNKIIALGIMEVIPNATVHFARGKAVHISGANFSSMSTKQKWDGFLRIFVDVSLLGKARHMVALKSGFADLASWLGAITDAKIVSLKDCPEAKIFKDGITVK